MPKLKIEHVISFSSEDPIHTSSNILSSEPAKKWKCATDGEKSANIILQLEKASLISNIDIGNENSAYVEVLVKRSGATDDFKVLLVMSSFMSPLESKQGTNINKVRMFGYNDLQHPERDQKWDIIKVVCTQPFNRYLQYGLSFITLHSPGDKDDKANAPNFGKFTLRPQSPSNLTIGSLFAKRDDPQPNTAPSAAAASRDASISANLTVKSAKIKLSAKDSPTMDETTTSDTDTPKRRNRNELLYSKDEDGPNERIDNIIKKRKKELEEKQVFEEEKHKKKQKKNEKNDSVVNGRNVEKAVPSTSHSNKKKPVGIKNENKIKQPFNKLLEGVTIVISGIQNPERSTIRSNALKLGAKYKTDWDNDCTHLVCAFTNTPKFNQVKGKGKIVNRMWISDCLDQRKRLPWRRYALDRKDLDQNESEEEILEDVHDDPAIEVLYFRTSSNSGTNTDTEDEIERISALQTEETKRRSSYSVDTDEEVYKPIQNTIIPDLPSILMHKTLYIDDELGEEQKKLLNRYIIALNGTVLDCPTDVDFIITSSKHVSVFKEICSSADTVSANWIWDSYNKKKLVPVDNYRL